MPWTKEEGEKIFESYWSNGAAKCPKCNAFIRFNYQPFMGDITCSQVAPSNAAVFKHRTPMIRRKKPSANG